MKRSENQPINTRTPRQDRAVQKVELILEAAILLLDKNGLDRLTTNAIAEKAGVSIGTLYQYFPNKAAVLDALADREMAALSQRISDALNDETISTPRDRIGAILRAITQSYGERRGVHRLVLEHSLANARGRIGVVVERIAAELASGDGVKDSVPLDAAEAFVLSNAFAGVMRAALMREDDAQPSQAAVEGALCELILAFVEARRQRCP